MPVLLILVAFDIPWALEKPDVEIMSEIIGRVIMFTVLPNPSSRANFEKNMFISYWFLFGRRKIWLVLKELPD